MPPTRSLQIPLAALAVGIVGLAGCGTTAAKSDAIGAKSVAATEATNPSVEDLGSVDKFDLGESRVIVPGRHSFMILGDHSRTDGTSELEAIPVTTTASGLTFGKPTLFARGMDVHDPSGVELDDGSWVVATAGCPPLPGPTACTTPQAVFFSLGSGSAPSEIARIGLPPPLPAMELIGQSGPHEVVIGLGQNHVPQGVRLPNDYAATFSETYSTINTLTGRISALSWTPPAQSFHPVGTVGTTTDPYRQACVGAGQLSVLDVDPATNTSTLTRAPTDNHAPAASSQEPAGAARSAAVICGSDGSPSSFTADNATRTLSVTPAANRTAATPVPASTAWPENFHVLGYSTTGSSVVVQVAPQPDIKQAAAAYKAGRSPAEALKVLDEAELYRYANGAWSRLAVSPSGRVVDVSGDGSILLLSRGDQFWGVRL